MAAVGMSRTLPKLPGSTMSKLNSPGPGKLAVTASPKIGTGQSPRVPEPAAEDTFKTRSQDIAYEKILLLFRHPLSATVHERHVASIERICRSAGGEGLPVRDLPHIESILDMTLGFLAAGDAARAELFEPALVMLMHVLSRPFVKRSATDEFKMLGAISSLLGAVARSLEAPAVPLKVKVAAAEMITAFASAHGNRPSTLELNSSGGTAEAATAAAMAPTTAGAAAFYKHQELIAKSGAGPAVARCFASLILPDAVPADAEQGDAPPMAAPLTADGESLRRSLLSALLELSALERNAAQLVAAGVARPLIALTVALPWRHALLPSAVELLWNLTERAALADYLTDRAPLLQQLADGVAAAVRALLTGGYSAVAKELRNDLLVVAARLMTAPAARAAFRLAGLLAPALAAVVSPELPEGSGLVKPFAQSAESADYELKLLMLDAAVSLCTGEDCEEALDAAAAVGLFHWLLLFVEADPAAPPSASPTLRRWAPAQAEQLQAAALAALARLLPGAGFAVRRHDFVDLGGPPLLLAYIRSCGVGAAQQQLRSAALALLRRACGLSDLRDALGEAGAVTLALEILAGALPAGPEASTDAARLAALNSLASLCRENAANRERLLAAGGVPLLADELVAGRDRDATLPSPLTAAALEAVWDCLVPCRPALARFLAQGGADALLDLLEAAHPYLQPCALGCLADLLTVPDARPFFFDWRARATGTAAAPLLCSIWRREEGARGVVTERGLLRNLARPLAGAGVRTDWRPAEESVFGFQEPSTRQALAQVREASTGEIVFAKVYAVCSTVGFEALAAGASAADRATLATISRYVKWKQGEVWMDLQRELEDEGVEPTEPDAERIASGIASVATLAAEVAAEQAALLHEATAAAAADEAAYYVAQQQQEAQEKEHKVFRKSKALLTLAERQQAKQKKEDMLRASIKGHAHPIEEPSEEDVDLALPPAVWPSAA